MYQTSSTTLQPSKTYTLAGSYDIPAGANSVRVEFGAFTSLLGAGTGRFTFAVHTGVSLKGRLTLAGNILGSQARIFNLKATTIASPPLLAAPELDLQGEAAPLALALGGLALMSERRRRRESAEAQTGD